MNQASFHLYFAIQNPNTDLFTTLYVLVSVGNRNNKRKHSGAFDKAVAASVVN